ncbi:hypothetical protein RA279_27765, partial [Pseudomonas syringae pv. tagetis]
MAAVGIDVVVVLLVVAVCGVVLSGLVVGVGMWVCWGDVVVFWFDFWLVFLVLCLCLCGWCLGFGSLCGSSCLFWRPCLLWVLVVVGGVLWVVGGGGVVVGVVGLGARVVMWVLVVVVCGVVGLWVVVWGGGWGGWGFGFVSLWGCGGCCCCGGCAVFRRDRYCC